MRDIKKAHLNLSLNKICVVTCVKGGDPFPFGVVLAQYEAVLVAGLAVGATDAVHAPVQVAQAYKQQ